MLINLQYLLSMISINIIVGFVSWPITAIFFNKLRDKGYAISHVLGWVVLSYTIFVLSTLKIITIYTNSILFIFLVWCFINFYIEYKFNFINLNTIKLKTLISTQIIFIILSFFWYWVRGYGAQIHQGEQMMDYAIIRSLFNAKYLPLYDMWSIGDNFNYYYFGHFLGSNILKLSKIPPKPGFFVLIIWLFASIGSLSYRFGLEVFYNIKNKFKNKKLYANVAGILSLFLVLFAGNFYSLRWLISIFKSKFFQGEILKFSYWDASRQITDTITEFPFFTNLIADLHSNAWGILTGILAIYLVFNIWVDKKFSFKLKNKFFYICGFFLGIIYMTQSWDILTLGSLIVFVIFVKNIIIYKKKLYKFLINLFLMGIFAYTIALPWSIFYHVPIKGIGIVKKISNISQWLFHWGPLLLLFIIFLLFNFKKFKHLFIKKKLENIFMLPIILFFITFLFWIFMEIFYIKDHFSEGTLFRFNTVFKISSQLWLFITMILGPFLIYTYTKLQNKIHKYIFSTIISFVLIIQMIYPIKAIHDRYPRNLQFDGINNGLRWWQERYPNEYLAFLYLKQYQNTLPLNDKVKNIVEADGDSYAENNLYSTFLGWPTILGWYGHEFTWHGSADKLILKQQEIRQIYTDSDISKTKKILEKYQIDFIIISSIEKEKFETIKTKKIQDLGKIIYENQGVQIIEVF